MDASLSPFDHQKTQNTEPKKSFITSLITLRSNNIKEDTYFVSELKPTEQKSLQELKEKLSASSSKASSMWGVSLLGGDDKADVILLKFLRARDFKVADSLRMLEKCLEWREEFKAEKLTEEDLGFKDLEGKVAYMRGYDKEGHPVCYNAYGVFKEKEMYERVFGDEEKLNKFLRWRVQVLERVNKGMDKNNQKKFVLVHGICHGAWCWYKVKAQLEAAGHSVTAVDLAASGVNMTSLDEIQTLKDYCKPLLEFLSSLGSDDDKVILVAHSMGGISASLAADIFPSKVAAIVFVAAFMPDISNPPAYVFQKLVKDVTQEVWMDTVFGKPDRPLEFALFGPEFMAKYLYNLSPLQDFELAKMSVRVSPFMTNNLWITSVG